MKKTITIWIIILSMLVGCKQSNTEINAVITVDVTAKYPKKELILQDFMDVEYIPLETSDDFLCQGFVQDIGRDVILVRNFNNNGDIFVFDRKGKAMKKINHLGQGAGEYTFIWGITLDEDNAEIFVNDCLVGKIFVYGLDGEYKRSFKHKEGAMYKRIYNFDRENLICHDDYSSNAGEANRQAFMLVSKQDGSITKEIEIPFKEKILTAVILQDPANSMTYGATPYSDYPIIPCLDNWVLVEPSSDTLFTFLPDYSLKPFVTRTPSVQSMNPEVFLFLSILSDRYYFMEAVVKKYNFETNSGYPRTNLMYDKQENSLFQCTVYNGDYSNKKQVYMNLTPVNKEIAACQPLSADELVVANKKGMLKGKLKEISVNLDEESNPVIMLLKHKK